MNQSQALAVLEQVLKMAAAENVTASLSGSDAASTRLADNAITQNIRCARTGLQVECAYGKSHGAAATDDLSLSALRAAVERAQAIARAAPPDPEYMPPVEAAAARQYAPVRAYFDATAGLSPLAKAQQLAAAAQNVQAAGLRLAGAYANGASFQALANSAGLRAYHTSTDASLHATVLGPAGSGWAERLSNNAADIRVAEAVDEARDIAQRAQNPQPLAAGKYDVVLSPAAVGELLLFTFWCGFDAKAADEGRTFLRGQLGHQVFGDAITLRSAPADARCPGTPFQEDGLASCALPWVERGVVTNLCYSRYWAAQQRKTPTGWPANLLMDGGSAAVEQMIGSIARGLLVTRFWYIRHVDPMIPLLTGMTRDGLFLIEQGRVSRPVRNMRFNENMVDALNRVELLGPVARTGDMPMLTPALKIRGFNFTSTTEF